MLLQYVLNIFERDGKYDNVSLHVQVNNKSAISLYDRFGFDIVETKENYYSTNITGPRGAYVMQKNTDTPISARCR